MSIKKIKEHNSQQFLDDLNSAENLIILAEKSNAYFRITKKELHREAAESKIFYRMTDEVFVRRRNVMVVL